jgi:IclR family transcriptional regulator, acetate operon repressor
MKVEGRMDSTGRSTATEGRGVLEGAFGLLDTLSRAPDGVGLSELARRSGLPKATTYRLVEQLVELGAVQRYGHRYHVGSLLGRLGRSWQPHPRLRQVAREPAMALAASTRSAVALTVLDGDRVRVVTATAGSGGELPWTKADSDLADRTAAGQVLLATGYDRDPPAVLSTVEWQRLRADLRRHGALVIDHENVAPAIRCVAAPVVLPDGAGTASISALVTHRNVPGNLVELVLRTAEDITRDLAVR